MARNHIQSRSIFSHHNRGKHELGEQLIIRVGKGCNFRCVFCNVAENESVLSIKSSIKEILAITFYKIKYSNFTSKEVNITISGGEPSIFQKETLFILKYFKKYFQERGILANFDLQSNASSIDKDFANRLKENGIYLALISSHTHDPEIFEKIIGVPYDTMGPRFEAGVQNLIDVGIRVTFNIVLNKVTASSYLEHLQYLVKKYPEVEVYNIGYVQPHGMAEKNFQELVAPYKDISQVYNRAIGYLKSHGKTVHSHYVGLPLCYMDDWVTSMEYINNVSLLQDFGNDRTLIQSINDTNKVHPKACERCIAKRVCSGVWKEYATVQELRTVPYQIWKKETIIDIPEIKKLKKSYDGGRRQFFFRIEDIAETNIIQELWKFGFIWVTLLLKSHHVIPALEKYAATNIQISLRKEHVKKWIEAVSQYNQSVSFQFQIQLDLLLEDEVGIDDWIRSISSTLGSNIHLHLKYGTYNGKISSPSIHFL